MSPEDFRRLALALSQVEESAHQGHPDFRVGGKVFATLGYPDADWAMVKFLPDEQAMRVEAAPAVFQPVKGGWGRQGCTNLRLAAADQATARGALEAAWRGRAPAKLRNALAPAERV